MPPTRHRCLECGAILRATSRTRQSECPECGASLEAPRRRRPASRGLSGNARVLVVVGVVLGVLLVLGVVLVVVLKPGGGGSRVNGPRSLDDPRVTLDSFANAHAELTLSSLESLLGPARKVSFEELPLKEGASNSEENRATIRKLGQKYRIRTWYLWKGKDRWAYAGFRIDKSSIVGWRFRKPDGDYEAALEDSENTLP